MTEQDLKLEKDKRSLRRIGLILVLSFVLLVAAFTVFLINVFRTAALRKEGYRFVGFSVANAPDFAYTANAVALADLPLSLDAYNARVYYESLGEADRLVYRAFEVALENGWEDVYLDDALLENCSRAPSEILILLALDSPFLEQNIRLTEGRHFSRYVSEGGVGSFGTMVDGVRITVDNFAPDRLARKKEALAEAERIAGTLSDGTERERAEAVFRYLLEHVTYLGEREFDDSDYLYDALCLGESNCDGFANSFSLLARLLELDVFEKNHQPKDGSVGHTWNCVSLDGVWYNVDVTYAKGCLGGETAFPADVADSDDWLLTLFTTFGFSDSRQRLPHDFEESAPACESDLIPADLVLKSEEKLSCGDLIAEIFEQTGKDRIIVVTSFVLDRESLQQAANRVGDLHCSTFSSLPGEYYCLVRQKNAEP